MSAPSLMILSQIIVSLSSLSTIDNLWIKIRDALRRPGFPVVRRWSRSRAQDLTRKMFTGRRFREMRGQPDDPDGKRNQSGFKFIRFPLIHNDSILIENRR